MIAQERLKELFNYLDGILYIKVARSNAKVGDVAGYLHHTGYHHIKIDGKCYKRSRLVYCFHHGYFPENGVDHINRTKNSDRIENLREVTQQCNMRNTCNLKNNTSGVKGVHWSKKVNKWNARITINQKKYNLGFYKLFHNAVCARLAGEQCLGWEGCDSSSPAFKYIQRMFGVLNKV